MDSNPGDISRRGFLCATSSGVLLAASAKIGAPKPAEYPLIRAAGSYRELGRQHGEQAAEKIKAHVEKMLAGERVSRDEFHRRALAFQPLFQKHCGHLVDELRGLGEGAGIPFAEALAVNIRGEMSRAPREGCTTYVIGRKGTAGREMLVGQNSDMTADIPPMGYILHLKPKNKPEVLMWTFGGMIGYHGMNSAGVAHFANALGGGPANRFGMPHYPVKRLMLECTSLEQVLHVLATVPLASNGNYVLCDGSGNLADVEATTAGPEVLRDGGAGFLAHTNHFVCQRYAKQENFAQSWQDSFPRLDRMNGLIGSRFGSLSVGDLQRFLSDHEGRPTSICRHDGDSQTVASLIAEPAGRRMHVAVGNPCEHRYVTYAM
jgi:isopenicillin-N N-acyltransferase-like protein